MNITVSMLQGFIDAGLNVIVTGEAGTGKTAMLKKACENLNLNMKYYSASTLDPFVELIGVPVPDQKNKRLDFYRPREVDEAEVIFFDELNRADSRTLNAVFEIIQFKSINGEALPKLKAVVAAVNPVSEQYDTERLDLALEDRFHVSLNSSVKLDPAYLRDKYGLPLARVLTKFFDEYQKSYATALRSPKNTLGYLSPRRADMMMEIYLKFQKADTIKAVLPDDVVVSAVALHNSFQDVLKPKAAEAKAPQAKVTHADHLVSAEHNDPTTFFDLVDSEIKQLIRLQNGGEKITGAAWARRTRSVFDRSKNVNHPDLAALTTAIARSLSTGISPTNIKANWGFAVNNMSPKDIKIMTGRWAYQKVNEAHSVGLI